MQAADGTVVANAMPSNSLGNIDRGRQRTLDILRVLDWTPATAQLLLKASMAFGDDNEPDSGFANARRVNEKMNELVDKKLVTKHTFTLEGRGATNVFYLAPQGYEVLYGWPAPAANRKFFRPAARLNWEHTHSNAEVIVKTLTAARSTNVEITAFRRENELKLQASGYTVEPDHFVRLETSGVCFNHLVEVDRNTETLDGASEKAWNHRILGYRTYQDQLLAGNRHDRSRRFRVLFLTTSMEHVYNFLSLAASIFQHDLRILFFATTIDEYLRSPDPLREPMLLDHRGDWHSMIDLHPTARFLKGSVRIPEKTVAPVGFGY